MHGRTFERQKPGEPIKATTINRPLDAIERRGKLRVGAGLRQQQAYGADLVSAVGVDRQWARVTGAPSSGAHPWQGIYRDTSGAWVDLTGLAGSTTADPLYEANGGTIATGQRVLMERCPCSGTWIVQHC